MAGLLVFAFRGARPYAASTGGWILPRRVQRVVWCSAGGAASLVLFALGFDWLRWITTIAFAALLAGASIVAIDGRARYPSPASASWHRPLPARVALSGRGVAVVAVATYLLVLPPLPNFVSNAVTGARLLFDIPQ